MQPLRHAWPYRPVATTLALLLPAAVFLWLANTPVQSADDAKPATLRLEKGDHICVIGNTLADRMQHDGWLEAYLHSRFPRHELVVRDLGFSADELTTRLRSMDFGSPDQWLSASAPVPQPKKLTNLQAVAANRFERVNTKADVVFAFFGYNESFGGEAGLPKFKKDLDGFIKHTLAQKYNGTSAPRLVLFSPIAHEDLKDRHLPDGKENNQRLELYTTAMAEAAKANGIPFVDLFKPTRDLYAKAEKPLTINGIHLTTEGNRQLAQVIDKGLFVDEVKRDPQALEKLRQAVLDKNFHWYQRYRATDGYSTFGDRAFLKFTDGQSNYEVVQRELEMLDVMTANRDKRTWAVAGGADMKVDDSNTPAVIPVKTNKPGKGPNGEHIFLDGEAAIQKMKIGKGLKVNLFASEKEFPDLANPVQMTWDTQGRLWVAVWPSYPHWNPKEEMNDKILILEDTKGTGKADKCTVFADKLHNPTGFEFVPGGVLVAQAPDLLLLKDTNGTGTADVRLRVLHGLDTADTHHTSNSFALDPGGAVYFQEGTFHQTQVETPYGPPQRCSNAGVFRYDARTQKFEVYATHGFANPHGHVFDRWGQDIVVDGTGSNPYHGTLFSGRLDYPQKHPHPPQVYKQRSRPCPGVETLSSRHFPDANQGNLLVGDVINFQGILQYKIADKGASFAGTEVEPIVSSTDPHFRPADIKMGPDGAIYFLDWHNPIIGHMQHNLRDPSRNKTRGRVYRVTAEGRDLLKPVKIAGEPIEKLLDLLKEPEDRVRYRARLELWNRDSEAVITAAKKWVASLDEKDPNHEHHVLEALWLHQAHHVVNSELLKQVLRSPDFRARAAATRVLCYQRERVARPLDLLRVQVNDAHPRVRLEAVRALSFFEDEQALAVLVDALSHPDDEFLKYTFKETLRQLEGKLGISGGGGIAGTIVKLLNGGKVAAARRPTLVETVCRVGGAAELKTIWDAAQKADVYPPDLRRQSLEWLTDAAAVRKVNPTGDLSAIAPLLKEGDAELRQAAIRLASAWKVESARPSIQQIARDDKEAATVRQAAIEGLALFADADSRKLLDQLAAAGPVGIRYLAASALANLDLDAAATAAASALADAAATDDPGVMLDAFLTRKGGPEKLGAALAKKKIMADPAKRALRHIYLAGRNDAALSNPLSAAAGIAADPKLPTPDEIKTLVAEVAAKGDATRGERIFRRADLGCMRCHAVAKAGGNVGPELSAVGSSSPADYVVQSILDPNAAIKEAYLTKVIVTTNGQIVTGIVVERDKVRVVLKDASGKLVRIPVADIEEEAAGKSLMPEGLTKFLTRDELLDLARFVAELGKPGPYSIRATPSVQRWRLLKQPDPALAKVVPDEEVFRQFVLGAKPEAWETVYGMVSGVLPLDEIKKTVKGDVIYLQGEIEASQAGPVTFALDAQEPTRVWIDGQAFDEKKKFETNLTRGRHLITLRVETGAVKAGGIKVELLKPAGSNAQFEVVNGT